MRENKKLVPKRRFKEFQNAGDWERWKLGKIADVYDGVHQTPDYKESGIMFLSVENISTLKSGKYISEEAFKRDYKVSPQQGDILMTRIGDVGTPNVVKTTEKLAFYVSLALLKPIAVDSYFLCNAIRSPLFQRGLKDRTLVTAIPQKINKDEIGKVDIFLPKLEVERKQVGVFFHDLDHRITFRQRKLEKMRAIKAAYLSELFPAEGEFKPKRKFKSFTDDWEQRKLCEEVESVDTGKSKFKAREYGKYEILGSTSVIGYDDNYDYEGDFLLTARVGANAGELYRHSGKVKISDNTVFIQGKNLDFIFYLLLNYDIKRLSFGTGQPLVKASELTDQCIPFPVREDERTQIGLFFRNLDNLITLHQRTLEKLQNIKKAYLNEMFIEGE